MTEETDIGASVPAVPADGEEARLLNRGGWANGDVYLTRIQGRTAVVKSYADKPLLIRWLGRYLNGRERKAYRILDGIAGIPTLLESGSPLDLALEFVAGDRISNHISKPQAPLIVDRLASLLEAMHQCGVYHMDLRNRGNVLVDQEMHPSVIDFASAVMLGQRNPLAWLVRPLCRRWDLYGLSKWRKLSQM